MEAIFTPRESTSDVPVYSTDAPVINGAFLRFVQGFLLDSLPIKDVYEFLKQFPLYLGEERFTGPELIRILWDRNRWLPLDYTNRLMQAIEPLFIQHRKDFRSSYDDFLSRVSLLGLSHFSDLVDQTLIKDRGEDDLKTATIRFATMLHALMVPYFDAGLDKRQVESDGSVSLLLHLKILPRSFKVTPADMDICTYSPARYIPCMYGDTPFDSFRIYSEERTIDNILRANEEVRRLGKDITINGDVHARIIRFHDFVHELGMDPESREWEDQDIALCTKSYRCPYLGREILIPGTAYGCRVNLVEFSYRPSQSPPDEELRKRMGTFMNAQTEAWAELEKKHRQLLDYSSAPVNVVYSSQSQRIAVEGTHITSGFQARILRHVLAHYVEKGKTEFQWRDLAQHTELISDEFSTGISLRLRRLSENLQSRTSLIRLAKARRGTYRLEVVRPVRVVEV